MKTADILKSLRLKKNVSQKEIAAYLGINRTTYVKYESGSSSPARQLQQIADYFGVTTDYILGREEKTPLSHKKGIKIPVLGKVQAGIPIEAIEEIIDYEEIEEELAKTGDFFGLQIRGTSMEPKFSEGDVVIVKKQSDLESGNIGIVLVNCHDATVKKIIKQENGIQLIPTNPTYDPVFYSNEDIEKIPITIIGRVIELRAKF